MKRLSFHPDSSFNLPLALPLVAILFADSYNQSTIPPIGIEELRVGRRFTRGLSFPLSLRKIEWYCNQPIQVPEGVSELAFYTPFNQPVVLPTSLKKAIFDLDTYTHSLSFPSGLKELKWFVEDYEGLVLPEGLRKLDWGTARYVKLPSGIKGASNE